MKKVNQTIQPNETHVSFPQFAKLNKLEMQLVKGGDGDITDEIPVPPPPPPQNK
jgi:hypothetical protein